MCNVFCVTCSVTCADANMRTLDYVGRLCTPYVCTHFSFILQQMIPFGASPRALALEITDGWHTTSGFATTWSMSSSPAHWLPLFVDPKWVLINECRILELPSLYLKDNLEKETLRVDQNHNFRLSSTKMDPWLVWWQTQPPPTPNSISYLKINNSMNIFFHRHKYYSTWAFFLTCQTKNV